jgi:hypothetical protein
MSNEPTPRNIIAVFGKSKSGKNTVGDMIAASRKGVTQIAFADRLKQLCAELFDLKPSDLSTDEGKARPTALPCPTCPMCGSIDVEIAPTTMAFSSFYDQPIVNYKGARQLTCRACGAPGSPESFKGFWTPRMILQHVATEGIRRVDPMVWARIAARSAVSLLDARGQVSGDRLTTLVVLTDGRFRSELAAVRSVGGIAWRVRRPETDGASVGIAGHVSETEIDGIPDEDFDAVITNDGTLDDLLHSVRAALAPSTKAA